MASAKADYGTLCVRCLRRQTTDLTTLRCEECQAQVVARVSANDGTVTP